MGLEDLTLKQWIKEISVRGPSDRCVSAVPVAKPGYKDPEGVKPERAALGAIVSARVHTRVVDYPFLIQDGAPTIIPSILQETLRFAKSLPPGIPATTGCSFRTPSELVNQFLDKPIDGKNALHATFNYQMGLIAA